MSAAGFYKGYNYLVLSTGEVDNIDSNSPMAGDYLSRKVDESFAKQLNDPNHRSGLESFSVIPSGSILIGNNKSQISIVKISGDATLNYTGTLSIAKEAVTTEKISDGAITPVKLSSAARTRLLSLSINPLPPPNGSDQINIYNYLFTAPTKINIVSAKIISSMPTTGSNSSNYYSFSIGNGTSELDLNSKPATTIDSELASGFPKNIYITDNKELTSGDILVLRTNIFDNHKNGPTDLSTSSLKVEVVYTV